jgi:hypothetical protein
MSVNAYLASGNLYLDLTNAKTVEFINEILSYSAGYSTMINPSDGTMTSLAPAINTLAAGKYLETGVLKADALPLLSEKTQKNISDDMASWSANLKANKDYFKTYSYANGNYAIDLSLTKETLLGLMSAATSAASSEAGGMTSAISSIFRSIGNDFHIYMEAFLNVLSLITQGANKKQCLLSKTCRKNNSKANAFTFALTSTSLRRMASSGIPTASRRLSRPSMS